MRRMDAESAIRSEIATIEAISFSFMPEKSIFPIQLGLSG